MTFFFGHNSLKTLPSVEQNSSSKAYEASDQSQYDYSTKFVQRAVAQMKVNSGDSTLAGATASEWASSSAVLPHAIPSRACEIWESIQISRFAGLIWFGWPILHVASSVC